MTLTPEMRRALAALVAAALVVLGLVAAALADDGDPEDPGGTTTTTTGGTTTTSEPTTTTEGTTTTEPPTTGTSTSTTSGGAMTVPATCRPEAKNSGARLRQDFPTDESTGPSGLGLDEDRLPRSGKPATWTITTAGTVVEGVFHKGRIIVAAPDVKITGSVVCGTGRFIVESQSSGLVIEDSILVGEKGTSMGTETGEPCAAAVGYGNYTVARSEVQGCADGLKVTKRVEVRDSYFHDNFTNRGGPSGEPGGGTHNDTVQQVNGALSTFVFEGNSAYQDPCTSNRHFQMAPLSDGSGGTWRIDRNFFYGIRVLMVDRGVRVADGQFTGNVLAGTATRGPFPSPLYDGDGLSTVKRSGNTYEDGAAANGNYASGYTCRSEAV